MILSDLTTYIAERGRVPLTDLAVRFEAEPEAVRGMLATLERKGRVRRIANGAACSGCTKCDQATVETYEWVGAPVARTVSCTPMT
jgi:putative ferrous iron transport protein C